MDTKNYHNSLSWDAQAQAELTGIALGWQHQWEFLIGCEICEFCFVNRLTPALIEKLETTKSLFPVVAEDDFEIICKEQFLREAKVRNCEHYLQHPKLVTAKTWDEQKSQSLALMKFLESRLSLT